MNTPKLPPLPKPSWPFGCKYNEKDMQAHYLKGYNDARAAMEAQGVPDGWTEDQIAQAAMEAEIPDAKLESLLIALASAPPAPQASVVQQEPVDVLAMPDTALGRSMTIDEVIYNLSLAKREPAWLVSACWIAQAILLNIKSLGPLYTHPAQQAKPQPLSDEQDRALCEAYCNTASDEYFNARPQLDSAENRRIFYAGHRKAWINWRAAHGIKE